jgi:hypothetical protein
VNGANYLRWVWLRWPALLLAVCLAGCTAHPAPAPVDPSAEQLHTVFRAYKGSELKLHHPPKSSAEISSGLEEAGASASDLVSPSDKKPYVIVWGTSTVLGPHNMPKGGVDGGFAILAYESEATDGKRFVLDIRGRVSQLTEEEFRRATFPAGHKPK